jgi:hypothetical protein
MLLILILAAWLAVTALVVALCCMAASGDASLEPAGRGDSPTAVDRDDRMGIDELPTRKDPSVPVPVIRGRRPAARRRWRSAAASDDRGRAYSP